MLAVQAVSSEPVSAEFPVKQGKNREFFQNQAVLGRVGCSNELLSHVFLFESPKRRNGIFSAEQGISIAEQGIVWWIREPSHGSAAASNRGPATAFICSYSQPDWRRSHDRRGCPLSVQFRPIYLRDPTFLEASLTSGSDPEQKSGVPFPVGFTTRP